MSNLVSRIDAQLRFETGRHIVRLEGTLDFLGILGAAPAYSNQPPT
jgi:hypothetical protein